MTKPIGGKLNAGCLDLPFSCDVCGYPRGGGKKHKRCSIIRQQRHADLVRDDEADRALMFDKKE